MIPQFPEFKKIELSDTEEVDSLLKDFPVYSDYDFASIWAWDVKEEIQISKLNGNLVIRFTDYVTGEPFYSFIGTSKATETATTLLALARTNKESEILKLIPEVTTEVLDLEVLDAEESRDHFDYVLELERYITYSGKTLKPKRNFFNSFKKTYPDYTVENLDLSDSQIKKEVTDLYRAWEENKGFLTQSEAFAYERFLDASIHFPYSALAMRVGNKLVGFHVSRLTHTKCANGLFQKADISYPGAYAALMHEVAKDHISKGYTYLNYEQDLGVENLRKSKNAFDPHSLLKKYHVTLKTDPTP
jgi:hypothetical protein